MLELYVEEEKIIIPDYCESILEIFEEDPSNEKLSAEVGERPYEINFTEQENQIHQIE